MNVVRPPVPYHGYPATTSVRSPRAADDELSRRVVQATEEIYLVRPSRNGCFVCRTNLLARRHLVYRSREYDAFALADFHLEITGREQVFVSLVAALYLLLILEVVVPVRSGDERGVILAQLHVEPREAVVQTVLHSVLHRIRTRIGIHVRLRKFVLVAERKERTQTQRGLGVRVHQRIANHQVRALVNPQQLLAKYHSSHAVGYRRCWRISEIGDVFMTARLVGSAITVQRQIERLVVLHDGLVERRQQYIGIVGAVDWSDYQSVIFARIAADYRGTHVAAPTVCRQHFALERIFQITQLPFIKSKSRHIIDNDFLLLLL